MQIPQGHMIQLLQEMGLDKRQLREYGSARTPESAMELYRRYTENLTDGMAHMQAMLDMLRSHLELLEEGRRAVPGEIEVRTLTERAIRLSAIESHKTKGLILAHDKIRQNGNPGCLLRPARPRYPPRGRILDRNFRLLLRQKERPGWPHV